MVYNLSGFPYSDELYHYGIPGMHWYVRRFQNPDGTLTAEGKIRYGSSDSFGSKLRQAIDRTVAARMEKKIKNRPWLMSDEELRNRLNRINMEKQYLAALKDVEKDDKRVQNWVNSMLEKGATTLATKAFEAAGNKIVAEQRMKDDAAYNKKMAKVKAKADKQYLEKMAEVSAKNKIKIDDMIDKAQRKQTKHDPSTTIYKNVVKNLDNISNDDLQKEMKKWESMKKMENRFRGANIQYYNTSGGGGGKNKGGG